MNHNIDKNAHYFILTRPMDYIPLFGMYIGKTHGVGFPNEWAECEIVEERYKLDDGYKVELRAINPVYGKETYYQCDFEKLVEDGYIIKKTSDKQHVEELTWHEPISGSSAYYVHTASVIVDD